MSRELGGSSRRNVPTRLMWALGCDGRADRRRLKVRAKSLLMPRVTAPPARCVSAWARKGWLTPRRQLLPWRRCCRSRRGPSPAGEGSVMEACLDSFASRGPYQTLRTSSETTPLCRQLANSKSGALEPRRRSGLTHPAPRLRLQRGQKLSCVKFLQRTLEYLERSAQRPL